MRIGVPKEIKPREGRVALVPEACGQLVARGHEVLVQARAGSESGFADAAYAQHGGTLVPDAATLYERAELIVKVKEPWGAEPDLLEARHRLFCFLHLAANVDLMERLRARGLTAIAFETLMDGGRLPILVPMSDIAGRLAIQLGATLLHGYNAGKGLLLGGLSAAERGRVVVLGAGNAGGAATRMAADMGALVTVFARRREQLQAMRELGPNVTSLYPYPHALEQALRRADILVGAVLVPGARAPHLVLRDQVKAMQPGSVIVDISVDQGGCIETTRPTTYENPTYVEQGVVHFAVTNMPGAVPRSASGALCASLMPYLLRLAEDDWRAEPALAGAVNLDRGEIVHPALKSSLKS